MSRKKSLYMGVIASLVITGCVSGYKQFYQPYNGATPQVVAQLRANPPTGMPVVDHYGGKDYKSMVKDYGSAGYIPIGYSSFNSGHSEPDSGAIAEAKKVGADLVVIISPEYTGTRSTVIPWTTPTASTSYTSGTATAYGSNGTSATAYGNSTTTTYGSRTSYIPIHTDRYDYGAIYFIKFKYKLGVWLKRPSEVIRENLGTNKALLVDFVVRDSPAYNSDIFPGDIIISVDGHPATSKAFKKAEHYDSGKSIKLTIERHGEKVVKIVKLSKKGGGGN